MAITLLEMLSEAGLISREQFDEALLNRVVYGGKIGTSLIELGLIEEETLARFLSMKLAVPYVHPDQLTDLSEEVIRLVPKGLALKYKVVPLRFDKRRLSLAMADPSDLRAVDEIAFITDFIVKPLIAPEVRLLEALSKYYGYEIPERYQHILNRMSDWEVSAAEAEEAQRAHEEKINEDDLEEATQFFRKGRSHRRRGRSGSATFDWFAGNFFVQNSVSRGCRLRWYYTCNRGLFGFS